MDTPQSQTKTTPTKTQPRGGANPGIDASPINTMEAEARKLPTKGRPKGLPPMPLMPMEEVERVLFDGFIDEYLNEYPDMTQTDYRLLFLAAIEYIKYLRIAARELSSNQVISMARQHPAVNMRALLDQLNATRKSRSKGKAPEGEDGEQLKDILLKLSQ